MEVNIQQTTQQYGSSTNNNLQWLYVYLCRKLTFTERYFRFHHLYFVGYYFTSEYTSFIQIKAKPVRVVRLFYLQDSLKPEAEKLKSLFSSNGKVHSSRIQLLTISDLIALMDPDDPRSRPYSDVVVILGHSNVDYFGSLRTSDIVSAFVLPEPPSFFVFLGCCGGSPRYGPLRMVSLLPEWQNTIFGCFRRRIYKDELCQTVPVLAIKYYLELNLPIAASATKEKILVYYSIACAYSELQCNSTCILNSQVDLSPAQLFLELVKSHKVANITTSEIPLSCWQLAMYHDFTVEKQWEFRNFILNIATVLDSEILQYKLKNNEKVPKQYLIKKLDKSCKAELKRKKLCDIIDLACKIQLLRVSKKTFALLRNNKWDEVDHLQFFVAMVQGYWGGNDYYNLVELATIHLKEIMKLTYSSPNENLHKYHLCCVAFCLFSPEVSIEFANSVIELNKFKIYKIFVQVSQIILPALCPMTALNVDEDELTCWDDVFGLCKEDPRFAKLYSQRATQGFVPIHNLLKDECDCKKTMKQCSYQYTYDDLMKALEVLKDSLVLSHYKPSNSMYYVKPFKNREPSLEYMQCFPIDRRYCEMRVIEVPKNRQSTITPYVTEWNKVSRCRFIFSYYQSATIQGNLYFTDSHYGQDKIPRIELDKIACLNYVFKNFIKEIGKKYGIHKEFKEAIERMKEQEKLNELLEELLSQHQDINGFQKVFERFTEPLLHKKIHCAIYKDKQTLCVIEKLKFVLNSLLNMNYFRLSQQLKISNKQKYDMQRKLLEETRKSLVQKFNDELDELCKNLNLRGLLVSTNVPTAYLENVSQIVVISVHCFNKEIANMSWQKLINNLSRQGSKLKSMFIEILTNQDQQNRLNDCFKMMLGRKLETLIKTVQNYLDKIDLYPFKKIGFLTLPMLRPPYLEML